MLSTVDWMLEKPMMNSQTIPKSEISVVKQDAANFPSTTFLKDPVLENSKERAANKGLTARD